MTAVVRPPIVQQPTSTAAVSAVQLQQLQQQQQRLLSSQKTPVTSSRGTTVRQQLMAVSAKAQCKFLNHLLAKS
jgi:hypothetical protein